MITEEDILEVLGSAWKGLERLGRLGVERVG